MRAAEIVALESSSRAGSVPAAAGTARNTPELRRRRRARHVGDSRTSGSLRRISDMKRSPAISRRPTRGRTRRADQIGLHPGNRARARPGTRKVVAAYREGVAWSSAPVAARAERHSAHEPRATATASGGRLRHVFQLLERHRARLPAPSQSERDAVRTACARTKCSLSTPSARRDYPRHSPSSQPVPAIGGATATSLGSPAWWTQKVSSPTKVAPAENEGAAATPPTRPPHPGSPPPRSRRILVAVRFHQLHQPFGPSRSLC